MRWRGAAWATGIALWLAGCSTVPAPDAQVSGTVFSRERLYVPPDAYFEAALVDVTDEGAPPLVLARQRVDPAGPLPYLLRIPYRQAQIQPQGRYEVRAMVRWRGRLLLDTPGVHPVLWEPAFRHVDVQLALPPQGAATVAAAVPLQQTYWRLEEIVGGEAVDAPAPGASAAHLVLQRGGPRASGSGGCNRFIASYAQQGGALRLSGFDASLRLCLAGGRSELAYLERLAAVAAFHQQGRALELRDADGQPLLRFTAQERGEPSLDDIEAPPLLPQ